MSKKEDLLEKLRRKPAPKNFSLRELDMLMAKCGCVKGNGGRGSSIQYVHEATKRMLTFDQPHPGKELYRYQIEKVIAFLGDIEDTD